MTTVHILRQKPSAHLLLAELLLQLTLLLQGSLQLSSGQLQAHLLGVCLGLRQCQLLMRRVQAQLVHFQLRRHLLSVLPEAGRLLQSRSCVAELRLLCCELLSGQLKLCLKQQERRGQAAQVRSGGTSGQQRGCGKCTAMLPVLQYSS